MPQGAKGQQAMNLENRAVTIGELEIISAANGEIDSETAKFLTLRRAIYENLVVKNSPIKEDDLTLDILCKLIADVGRHYAKVMNLPTPPYRDTTGVWGGRRR